MREIKFRGRDFTGTWWKGDLLHDGDNTLIATKDRMKVYVTPETVGQYTSYKDKDGGEIYEGDLFHNGDPNILYVVVWRDCGLVGKQLNTSCTIGLTYWKDSITVIGNIHDNPELLQDTRSHRIATNLKS